MTHIDLPRPIEAYFAFAELPCSKDARRFIITLNYLDGGKLDRLQWWWQAANGQLRVGGEMSLEAMRREATARFASHVETWLINSNRRLSGGEPFPKLEILPALDAGAVEPERPADVVPLGVVRSKGQAA